MSIAVTVWPTKKLAELYRHGGYLISRYPSSSYLVPSSDNPALCQPHKQQCGSVSEWQHILFPVFARELLCAGQFFAGHGFSDNFLETNT